MQIHETQQQQKVNNDNDDNNNNNNNNTINNFSFNFLITIITLLRNSHKITQVFHQLKKNIDLFQ